MRRLSIALGPVVLSAIVFACEEDTPNPNATITFPEAGLLDTSGADRNVPDVAPPLENVTVSVVGRAEPKAGVTIVFHDGLGAVLESKVTAADGKATRTGAVSMVTALLSSGTRRQLVTWTGVLGGDELVVSDLAPSTPAGSYDVTLAGFFSDAGAFGASRYTAYVGTCSSSTTGLNVNVPLTEDCVAPANNAVLVRADEDLRSFDEGLGYSFAKGLAAPDGGTTAVATGAWEHRADFTVDLVGKPALGASAGLVEISGATAVANTTAFSLNPNPAVFRTAKGFADALVALATVRTATPGSTTAIGERFAAAGVTQKTFDYAQRLPEVSAGIVDAAIPHRPFVTWDGGGALATITVGGIVDLTFRGPSSLDLRWSFFVAPGATNVRAPALPSPTADAWLPEADAAPFVFGPPAITFVSSSSIPSYLFFRKQAGVVFAPGVFNVLPLLPSGTFRVTRWFEPPS